MLIEELNLSTRTYNCLKRAKIETVEQLSRISDDDLMRIRSFGQACLAEVRAKVALPKKTNADRIRSMSDAELAEILGGMVTCPPTGECAAMSGDCETCFLKWLQQPAEVEHGM